MARLAVLIATVAAVDAILVRVHVDLVTDYKITPWLLWSLLFNFFLLIELIVFPTTVQVGTPIPEKTDQPKAFVTSLINFAETLETQGKTTTVLEIRDS